MMMAFEAELMYGPLLLQEARARGVVYICADGDQLTAIKQLVDDVSLWGFEPVMLGNMKVGEEGLPQLISDGVRVRRAGGLTRGTSAFF